MNYAKLYNKIVNRRLINNYEGYTEEHHIIPRSLGGTDDKSNLVKLTAKEHFICHLLLTKMYVKGSLEYYKMCHAFFMMLVDNKLQSRHFTGRKYQKLKIDFSKRMSELGKGSNNSQFGTIWINNPTLKQCKKVPKDSTLENGWVNGRVIIWDKPAKIKVRKPKKIKLNPIKICCKCGEEKCQTNDICSRHQMTNTFIQYFNFDKTTIGTKNFIIEFNRIIRLLNDEYNVNKLSVEDIKIKYNLTSNERTRMILKSLGISRRNFVDAYKVKYGSEV